MTETNTATGPQEERQVQQCLRPFPPTPKNSNPLTHSAPLASAFGLTTGLNTLLVGTHADHKAVVLSLIVEAIRLGSEVTALVRDDLPDLRNSLISEVLELNYGEACATSWEEATRREECLRLVTVMPCKEGDIRPLIDHRLGGSVRLVVVLGLFRERDQLAAKTASALHSFGEALGVAMVATITLDSVNKAASPPPPRQGKWLPAWLVGRCARVLLCGQRRQCDRMDRVLLSLHHLHPECGTVIAAAPVQLVKADGRPGVAFAEATDSEGTPTPAAPLATSGVGAALAHSDKERSRAAYEEMLKG